MEYIDRQHYIVAKEVEGEATKHSEYIIRGGFVAFRNVTYIPIAYSSPERTTKEFPRDSLSTSAMGKAATNRMTFLSTQNASPKSVPSGGSWTITSRKKLGISGRLSSPEIGAVEMSHSKYTNHGR